MFRRRIPLALVLLLAAAALSASSLPDPADAWGMRTGAPDVRSMGPMAFAPDGVLFIGDSDGAAIHAIRIEDDPGAGAAQPIDVAGIDARIAAALGTTADQLLIHDMAVHPQSRNVYLTVSRGRGNGSQPVLLRVTREGGIEQVVLENVDFSTAAIPDAPDADPEARRDPRTFTVTDLAFADGDVFIAGLSNEEFSSAFRRMPFPFDGGMATTTLEIYHVSHGRNETHAPVMTFMPEQIDGTTYILAAYTCTPLVAFPIDALNDGDHVFGRTVAELGAGNQPLDIIGFERDGRKQILIANSRHPLMRIDPADVAGAPGLTSPTEEPGIPRTALERTGIRQLADLNADHVVVLHTTTTGGVDLKSLPKSSL